MRLLTCLPVLCLLGTGACAPHTAGSAPCAIAAADSAMIGDAPLYPECALDHRASDALRTTEVMLDVRPFHGRCADATMRFVVDTSGAIEAATARIVRTNDVAFAQAVLRLLALRQYAVSHRDGQAVRALLTRRFVQSPQFGAVRDRPEATELRAVDCGR